MPFGAEYAPYLDGSGNIRSDLLGGKHTDPNAIGLDVLAERKGLIDSGYDVSKGGWGQGNANTYRANYSDHDNDASTKWVAPNSSNINRAGMDVSADRNAVRSLGYQGLWGLGGGTDAVQRAFSPYGFSPTSQTTAGAVSEFGGFKDIMDMMPALTAFPFYGTPTFNFNTTMGGSEQQFGDALAPMLAQLFGVGGGGAPNRSIGSPDASGSTANNPLGAYNKLGSM